ncbi:MAG: hypothetical protein HFJ91_04350 [Muribaculaceae bacterium]|nr:hypothetical protein [Muribaculaceae bacterium]
MDKNSTPSTSTNHVTALSHRTHLAAPARPRRATLDRIRQFARAYTCMPAPAGLGGMVMN